MTLFIFFLITLWLCSGLRKLPVGWCGLVLILGKRTKWQVKEGWKCLPVPWGLKATDCRQVVKKLDNLGAKTSEGVGVKFDASFVYKIVDLYTYFGVDEKTVRQGLDDARDQEIRQRLRHVTLDQALNLQIDIAKEAKKNIGEKSCLWGIEIFELFIAEIRPDVKVDEDLNLKKREELQRDGQRVEMDHLGKLVSDLEKPKAQGGHGLSHQEAYEAALFITGKADPKKIYSLDPATSAAVAAVMGRK